MIPDATPLDEQDFDCLMAAFAPFEASPRLALAVSGGADSMALALLATGWTADRGGAALALIVDHGLRPESAREAALVADRCRALGLESEILPWTGETPASGIEAAARRARYLLLGEACRRHGCLHLLTAHHGDDQAETVTLRRAMASGAGGLAGMSACVEQAGHRLLRPFLPVSRARLAATVGRGGLARVDDPMNRDPRFARARLRRTGGAHVEVGAGERRIAFETRLVEALATCARVDHFGVGYLDRSSWRGLDKELTAVVLARLALTVGGGEHAPGGARLAALAARIAGAEDVETTLGRCQWRSRGGAVVLWREMRHLPGPQPLDAGSRLLWDGRFSVAAGNVANLTVAPLGAAGWRVACRDRPEWRDCDLPAGAAAALPGLFDLEGLLALPHLGPMRCDRACAAIVRYQPRHSLSPVPFLVPAG